jgi:phospholipid/cholesterol/gamma-HCH transport system substrate-binding protein
MELRYRREALVGVLIVAAAVVFFWMMLWLRGKELRQGALVRASFADVAGLKVGDPVRTSGVSVGQVRRVALVEAGRVDVWFSVKQGPRPRADAAAAIRPLDFFGARFIEYLPGTAERMLDADSAIRGQRAQDITELAEGLSGQGREFLANATDLLAPSTVAELREVLVQARRSLAQLGAAGREPSERLVGTLEDLRRVTQRLDLLLANTSGPATATVRNLQEVTASVGQVAHTLTRATATLDSLLVKLNSGRGTFGQLVNDTTFLAELRRTNRHLDSLVTDFMANPKKYINVSVF